MRQMAWAACGKASPVATAAALRVRCSSRLGDEELCVGALGVHRVGKHDAPGQVQGFQQGVRDSVTERRERPRPGEHRRHRCHQQ